MPSRNSSNGRGTPGRSSNGRGKRSSRSRNSRRPRKRSRDYPWAKWPWERLLDTRLCDLRLDIEGSWLEKPIERLRAELEARDLRVRPHFWLSEEWFCPDGVPGIAIPFYLAHPRLTRLQRMQRLEVEGGTPAECMKLMRHEAGHVVQQAFRLHRRPGWRRIFGTNSQPYPDYYAPRPASKRFVLHLGYWYAQAHPIEDFAETFAVWLTPRSGWRRKYQGWRALEKLEYVDDLMQRLAGTRPQVLSRERTDSLSRLRMTLREHYDEKREHYGVGFPDLYDADLRRLFSDAKHHRDKETAAAFLRRNRTEIRQRVARFASEHVYTTDQVLKEIIGRCRELKLRAAGGERRLKEEFALLLSVHTMRCLYRTRDWHAM